MRRRTFVAGSVTAFGSFLLRPAWAQHYPSSLRRAAVVIGVDTTGGLPTLNAAVSGAAAFAAFLRDNGFDVHEFLSSNGDVREDDLTRKLHDLVGAGNLDQLVVYFAGHGLMRGGNEVWLLSGAPENGGEAVTVLECQRAARGSGITNVVLIGDTCRSLPDRPEFTNMPGSVIFPNLAPMSGDFTVDTFYATLPGEAALEVPVDKAARAYEGIFTSALIDVFGSPPPELVVEANGTFVIPNRKLRNYMRTEVNRRAQAAGIQLAQHPQLEIMSDEPWNIGAVRAPIDVAEHTPADKPMIVTVPDALRFELQGQKAVPGATVSAAAADAADRKVVASLELQARDAELDASGIAVYGTWVESAVARPGIDIDVRVVPVAVGPDIVTVELGDRAAATVVVRFANGLGAPVAVLNGYGTHVTVDERGVADIRYTPVAGSGAFEEFRSERDRLTRLRALARTAAKSGVLSFEGTLAERESASATFAGQIRMLKRIDPTLGIYAAYAYDAANLPEQAKSVAKFMEEELFIEVFDPAMLALRLTDGREVTGTARVVPFCPVLRQGWELLRVKGVTLEGTVLEARPFLTSSLFTTFTGAGAALLADAVGKGTLD